MDVHLKPETEDIIRGKLKTGDYSSVSDVVGQALKLLDQRDEIRKKISEGLQSLQEGRGITEEKSFDELRSRHEQFKRAKRK